FFFIAVKFLLPFSPKLFGGGVSSVRCYLCSDAQCELRIHIQTPNAIFLLTAQMLTDGLPQWVFHIRSFALDDTKRNTIDKQHQIGAVMLFAGASHYAVFFAYMKHIVPDVFPVNVLQGKTLFVAIYTLLQCLS